MMKRNFSLSLLPMIFCSVQTSAISGVFDSATSGNWSPASPDTWAPSGNPQTGGIDTINILSGHTVLFDNVAPGAGLVGSNDMGVGNGNAININGGVLSQKEGGWWVRIGHAAQGTLNINDGRFHITNQAGAGGTNLQVGVVAGGSGIINVGDNVGAARSAVLNMRDVVNGTANSGAYHLNLGTDADTSGTVIVNSDGVLEGDQRVIGDGGSDPHIRVGQVSSATQSILRVNAGGQVNVRGNLEVGAQGGAKGLLHLTGAGARADMTGGQFTVGFEGSGEVVIENGAVFSRADTAAERLDQYVGRNGSGVGTVTVRGGGQFLREAGGNVGDLRIGFGGTGTLNVETGGTVRNDSGNWDWVGQNAGSTGTINVTGGTYEITTGSNLNIAQNGNGTFRQTSGSTNVSGVFMAENDGTAVFDVQGGTFAARAGFYLGGTGTDSTGGGSATATQSGGTVTIGGGLSIGLAGGHTGSYTLTGGALNHTGSDTSVGESGTGTFSIGAAATVSETTSGQFFVGRNDGSRGTLIVNGELSKTGTNSIRVGNGNTDGIDNTTANGLLGGTGTITAAEVRIGSRGTVSGGLTTTVGTLKVAGNLSFSSGGTLFANFDGTGGSDTLSVLGEVNIAGSILDGEWAAGGDVGPDSRYWIIQNDGAEPIQGTFANTLPDSAYAALYPDAGAFVTVDGQEFAVFYGADSLSNSLTGGNDVMLSAVPEPSVGGLALMAGLLAARRRR